MDIAISVKNLSKRYKLYDTPQHRLKEALHPFRKKYHRDFWALKDISFEVKKGETVGIIGKNGSGKSTLLQVICGTLAASSGVTDVNGRVAALLELGAGFNPEFTGRDNVYMNASLMGLSREEVDARFDDIASFADIGDFIDQPVKTYSSGMYVRLAFAVAINVDPDILIVDEALAVGDIRFQQKCFRKMHDFRARGKTILVVTHDMGAVKKMCDRAVWINDGRIVHDGDADEAIQRYLSYMVYNATTGRTSDSGLPGDEQDDGEIDWEDLSGRSSFGEGGAEIKRATFYDRNRFRKTDMLSGGEDVTFMLDIQAKNDIPLPIVGFTLSDKYGNNITGTNSSISGNDLPSLSRGERITVEFSFRFPKVKNGEYILAAAIADGTQQTHVQHHWVHDAYVIHVASREEAATMGWYLLLEDVGIRVNSRTQ